MTFMRIATGFLSAAIISAAAPLEYPLYANAAGNTYENILEYGGFEQADSYDFPIGWTSNGKNLLQNGDLENGSFDAGDNYYGDARLKWLSLAGVGMSLENSEDTYGQYRAKLMWNEAKWGGIGIHNNKGIYPLSYGSDYIYRGMYKLSDENVFPQDARTQFNTIFYTSDTNYTERVDSIDVRPNAQWQEISHCYSIREKLDTDEYQYPRMTRWQFRLSKGAEQTGIYADNLKMEKLGRTDTSEKYSGERALKIVAYNDGVDEVWTSGRVDGITGGRTVIFGTRAKLSGISGEASLRLNYYDMYGNYILSDEKTVESPDSDWHSYEFASIAPEDAKKVDLELVLKGATGTAWFDDCHVDRKTDSASAREVESKYAIWYKSNYSNLFKGDAHIRAAVAARYYRYFGTSKYLTDALNSYREMMTEWSQSSSAISSLADDFFSGSYIIETYIMLRTMGYTTDDEKDLMLNYINQFFRPSLKGSHNQVTARAEAMAYAVKAFPDEPAAASWQAWLDMYWNILDSDKDIQEDAGDYNGVAMRDMIRWLKVSHNEERLLDEGWRQMFLRYLYQQAPNGSMPEYGDDFYGRTLDWIYIFEYLADLYDSPEFAYGARRAFDWGTRNAPSGYCTNSETLELLPRLYGGDEQRPELASEITTRRLVGGEAARNKILLRNSKGYVWIDNTYNLSHAHKNSKGAVTYYEYDNVPLFHSFQRRFVDARFQNRMAMLEPDEDFPFNGVVSHQTNPGRAATNTWYHDTLPLTGLPESDAQNPNLRDLDQICLRLSKEKSDHVLLTIDNIRLEGPAGTYMIYDFEDGTTGGFKGRAYTNVEDGYGSNRAMTVRVDSNAQLFNKANLWHKFDITQYNCLKWDWKTATDDNDDMTWLWFVMRVWDRDCDESKVTEAWLDGYGDCYVEMNPGEISTFTTDITDAYVEDRGGDSYAELELGDFFGTQSTQKRRIVLTDEGYLVIQDTLYPSLAADGYRAGAIWGLYNVSERGSNWFLQAGEKKWYSGLSDSKGKANGLFVMFSDTDDARIDSMSIVSGVYTQSASRIVQGGVPQSFITVVAPNIDDKKTGEELADSIKILKDGVYQSGVSYQTEQGWVHVEFPPDGNFSVTRNASDFAYVPEISKTGTEISVKSAVFGSATPMLALYENNILKRIVTNPQAQTYGDYAIYSMSADLPDGDYSAKVFVWDKNMHPLTNAVQMSK